MDSRQANPSIGGRNDNWERGSSLDGGFRTTPSGRLDLTACVVRLSPTSGLTANEINLSQRRTLDNPDIGVLVINSNPEIRPASPRVLVSTLNAPPKAAKSLEKAREELSKEKINYKKAAGELEKAVKEYPQFTEAWTLLGESYSALNESQKAFDAFSKGAETGEDYVPLYLNLARVYLEKSAWQDARQNADKALAIEPTAPHGLFYMGISSYYLNDFEASEGTLRKLRENGHSQEFPVALLHLGMIHIKQNKIQEAAVEFREYLDYSPGDMVPPDRRKKIEAQLESWRNLGLIE
jgi:tetratricopeptide (TPR) repeat protein